MRSAILIEGNQLYTIGRDVGPYTEDLGLGFGEVRSDDGFKQLLGRNLVRSEEGFRLWGLGCYAGVR